MACTKAGSGLSYDVSVITDVTGTWKKFKMFTFCEKQNVQTLLACGSMVVDVLKHGRASRAHIDESQH